MMAPMAITPKLKRILPIRSTKPKPEIAPQHLPSNITVCPRGNQAPVPPLNLEEEIGVEVPGAGVWTKSQRDAFELQCSIIGANDRKYFEKIATGVQGKSASDCRALLEATWASPRKKTNPLQRDSQPEKQAASNKRRLTTGGTSKKRASTGPVITKETPLKRKPFYSIDNNCGSNLATPVSKPSNGGATPEIVMHVRKASKTKRGRDTAKYRRNVRHLAEVVARDTSDDVIEPTIVTPDAATGLMSRLRQVGPSQHDQFLSEMGDGTPGTEVRLKRAEAELSGQVATPEILARGKSIGFSAMDNFVAAFKRRTGAAAPAAPSFSQPQAEPQLPIPKQAKVSRRRVSFASVRFNDEDKADDDSDDDMERDNDSEDDDELNSAI